MKSYRTIEAYRNPREAKEVVNSKFKTRNSKLFQPAFTLVEVLIVVAILGILAAIVLPEVQGYTEKAKENAAKDNLRILRETIERYAAEHNDVAPGYIGDNPSSTPSGFVTIIGLTDEYINEIPVNPLNGLNSLQVIVNGIDFPESANDVSGWIYKPATKEVKLNTSGTDSEGVSYYDY